MGSRPTWEGRSAFFSVKAISSHTDGNAPEVWNQSMFGRCPFKDILLYHADVYEKADGCEKTKSDFLRATDGPKQLSDRQDAFMYSFVLWSSKFRQG
jgi:hypothetical protein